MRAMPRDVLEVHEPGLLVETLHVGLKVRHRLALLDDRVVDPEAFARQEPEYLVADDLQVLLRTMTRAVRTVTSFPEGFTYSDPAPDMRFLGVRGWPVFRRVACRSAKSGRPWVRVLQPQHQTLRLCLLRTTGGHVDRSPPRSPRDGASRRR